MSNQCDFHVKDKRCIYVQGHGGDHYSPCDGLDHSDEIRIRVLRDDRDRLQRELDEARAKGESWKEDLDRIAKAIYPHKQERFTYSTEFVIQEIVSLREAKLTLQSVVGTIQRLQPGGSPPGGGPIVLVPWIVRATVETLTALRERAEKAERDRVDIEEQAQAAYRLFKQQIATLTEERDDAQRLAKDISDDSEDLQRDNTTLREAAKQVLDDIDKWADGEGGHVLQDAVNALYLALYPALIPPAQDPAGLRESTDPLSAPAALDTERSASYSTGQTQK